MEITFEDSFEDPSDYFSVNKNFGILNSLPLESFNRNGGLRKEERLRPSFFESPNSPLSLDENRPKKEESIKPFKMPLSSNVSYITENKENNAERTDFMHNQLKKPDFNQFSHIYKNYISSPKSNEKVKKTQKASRNNFSISRPASAPLSRKSIVQDLIKERELEFQRICTFKPKINKTHSGFHEGYGKLTTEQRIHQLARPKSEQNEKRAKLKREQDELKYSECTFHPSITPYNTKNKSFSEFPVDERLYQDAELKFYERERLQREKEDQIAANFPFRPQIQGSNQLIGHKKAKPPIYQRLNEVQKEITENRNNIIIEAEKSDPNLTFKPKINAYSQQLLYNKKKRGNSLVLRGCRDHKFRCLDNTSYEKNFTFTPLVSSFSSSCQDFLKRQQVLQEKSKAKKAEMIERMQKTCFSFTPDIDRTSKIIVETDKNRKSTKIEERLLNDLRQKKDLQADLEQKYYGMLKFEPQINQISKALGRSTSLSEIADNSFSQANRKKEIENKAIEEERKYNYTPRITKGKQFEYITSSYKQSENLLNTIKGQCELKQKKCNEIKKNKEFEEMKECTFTPKGVGIIGNYYNKASIRGLERFLELREIAKRREEEAKEREKKVFLMNPKMNASFFTTPKPFNLHPSNKKQKIEKIRQEILRKEEKECVFHPQLTFK